MSQEHNDSAQQMPSPEVSCPDVMGSRSDTAFPSILVMGICLVFVIVLVGITGWKVLQLEQEGESIRQQRAILERDVNTFKQYKEELPQLEKQHGELTSSAVQLEGTLKALQQMVQELTQRRHILAEESASLSGNNAELTSRINAARKELGQAQSELTNVRPLVNTAKKELSALQSQEDSFRTNIADLQKHAAVLAADIQGLERSQEHAQYLLARMTEDQKVLDGFGKTVESMVAQLQTSSAKADSASNEYTRQTTNVQTATRKLDAEIAAMKTRLQTMNNHISTLERHSNSFLQMLDQSSTSDKALQTQIQVLTEENKQLESALQKLDSQVQQWTQRSQSPLAKINDMEQKLLPLANVLTSAVQTLTEQTNVVETQAGLLRTGIVGVQGVVNPLGQQVQNLSLAIEDIQAGVRLSTDNGETLSRMLLKMQQDVDVLAVTVQKLQQQVQESSSNNP